MPHSKFFVFGYLRDNLCLIQNSELVLPFVFNYLGDNLCLIRNSELV